MHKVCTKAILLGERSVRIREVKGSNPSRSTFSSSVILTLLLFFCIHISHALALGPRGIRTARPCRRQGKQSARWAVAIAVKSKPRKITSSKKPTQSIIANRTAPKAEPMVDGYVGFLFLDKNDKPMVALHWEKYMEHIIEKYNKIYRVQMPKVTPNVCRHTFCSNMAKSGMNPKTLQYIMGHADISVTLNTYTHVKFDDAKEELLRVATS